MNKKIKKLISVLLCCVMLIGVLPLSAFAEGGSSTVTNGQYTGDGWAAGGTGSATYNVDGTNVTLSKTAAPVEGMENTFDITLTVQTSTSTSQQTPGGAVVLVIDTSSSMKSCSECGGRDYHNRGCEHYESGWGADNSVSLNNSRLIAAQAAARTFLASYAGTDASANRMLAIVTFDGGYDTKLSWVNVAGGADKNSYNAALTIINGLGLATGTNMEGGLYNALGLVGNAAVSSYAKNVVLLSDGAPSVRMDDSRVGPEQADCTAAATRATAIKNAGATLYTVCFGAARDTAYGSVLVGDFLSGQIASSGCAYTADNSAQLNAAFAAISESITSGLSGAGWTATDPMADKISVVGTAPANFTSSGGDTYTWTLSSPTTSTTGNVTTYTYTCTYRVELDVQSIGFEENKYYPTNGPTYLNIDGKQYAFPVPGVQGVLPRTSVSVEKIWDDESNRDNIRTDAVTVQLYEEYQLNGITTKGAYGNPVTLNAANGWTHTWEGMIEKSENVEHVFSIEEINVPEGYEVSYGKDENGVLQVVNKHEAITQDITVTKTWDDNDNQDGIRPVSITVNLLADGEKVDSAAVKADQDGKWTHTFHGFPVNRAGKVGEAIVYTVVEEAVAGYEASYNGLTITNTHAPEKTAVSVAKVWDDKDDQDGIRPNDITVKLLADGADTGKTLILNQGNNWTGSFTELDKYKSGTEIKYTVAEVSVTGYTSSVTGGQENGYTITNSHTPEVVEVAGSKTWNDNNNQDGARPKSITINLLADGEIIKTITVTEADGWTWSFTGLPKNKDHGTAINYSITEESVEDYSATYNGYNVTNTHTPAKTSVTVTKSWQDSNDQDGARPNDITVTLVADGVETNETLVLNAGNGWTGSFTELDKYAAGELINYSVKEVAVPGYETVITGDMTLGYTITNTHTPETVDVTGSKTWDDNDNQDGARPESITINLLADGEVIDTITVTEDDGWAWSFTGLAKYKDHGTAIKYSVTEESVENYSTTYNGYNVTNTHTPEKTSVTVTKSWQDNNDQDGIRPNDITVKLLADGADTGKTLILNQGNNWTGSFTELDKYADGEVITYTVAEVTVAGYNTVITGDQNTGYTVTNSHTPETVEVSGSKTWVDNNDQDGFQPDSITINLLKNGTVIASAEVTEKENWAWSFINLPKYENGGNEIIYTITEEAVEDYSTEYEGYNVINTHAPEKTSVTVTKSWQDNNDQDGIRSEDVTVKLLANGIDTGKTLILSEGNKWTDTFTDLDKYAEGNVITYKVEEISIAGYNTVITGDQTSGYTITNSHTPETVEVSGGKTWDDKDNQDGARPESITINLLADGEIVKTIPVTESDGWAWSFENLPKYKNHGTLITYSVSENAVDGYSTEYNGYNVINTHAPEKTSVTVTKSWKDNDDQDGIRPNEIKVILVSNGTPTETVITLSDSNNWTGSFTDLDKYAAGKVIDYTVKELDIDGYHTVITGTQDEGYLITNSHTPATVEVIGSKTWEDNNDQDGFRPDSITINLLKNGKVINSLEVTERDNWSWSFTELPEYENKGTLINYSVTEEAVDGYTTTYDGYDVTNTHAPEKTSVTVTKAWQDNGDQDGIRPNDITVKLLADGVDTGKTMVLSQGNNWTGSFTDLDKYAAGEIVNYTVEELAVEGYNTVITGTQSAGYTITNSHTPEVFDITGSKIWDDNDNQDGARPQAITVNLLANGNVVETAEVTEADEWSWTFTNLPKYENGGNEIIYTVTEEAVEDYSTEYEGYDIINTHTPEKTSVTVTKAWADSNDQDGIRPKAVTVVLLANGEETRNTLKLNADNNWTGSFTELDKFADGEEIVYSVKEVEVEGYSVVITGNQKDGYVITNTHAVELTAVEGSKTWDDNNNQDGVRPASITVNLLANGKVVNTLEVTAEDNWSWSFTGLPKYENGGNEIVYTVTENAVEGYTTSYDGFNVINSYDPEKISITVNKAWADSNDAEGIRPNKVTIKLYADGEDTGLTLTLKEGNSWKGTFADLDKFADGKQIEYTIVELAVKGYNTVVTGSAEKGFIVTNSHTYIPQTGDERTPVLWISLMAVSMLMIAFAATGVGKKRSSK